MQARADYHVCPADRTHTLQVGAEDTVYDVKAQIAAREGTHKSIRKSLDLACLVKACDPVSTESQLCRALCTAGISADEQRLVFGSKQLSDETTLVEAGVSDDSALYVLLRLLGGGKKRKKKTYTKPKKQKHKHKKVKLAVLKFYKVNPRAQHMLHLTTQDGRL